ncbi:MAG: cytoplasmic protein [Armatimonadetes bacterium]|nr:cytoplasmic protein [Armatimonadota bacterium]
MTAVRRFVGEPITEVEPLDASVMASGQPSAPGSFLWRGETYVVKHVLSVWKDISDGSKGDEPGYVRKHWFRLQLTDGGIAEVYFLRQPQGPGKPRWILYTLTSRTP